MGFGGGFFPKLYHKKKNSEFEEISQNAVDM